MHAAFYKNNPFRSPQWRADRVMQMVERKPTPLKPKSFDDHYVRSYRRFLLAYLDESNEELDKFDIFMDQPHLYQAHMFHWYPDKEWRQILQAYLLTGESFADIAMAVSTEETVVDHYEKLFFNIRDRQHNRAWMIKTVLGSPEERASNKSDTMTEDQRGFMYRLYAYTGGTYVLEAALLSSSLLSMPKKEEIAEWWDASYEQMIRSRATTAARIFEINRSNVMFLLELASGMANARVAAKAATGIDKGEANYADQIKIIAKSLRTGMLAREMESLGSLDEFETKTAIEPRVAERLAISRGEMPQSLLEAQSSIDRERIKLHEDEALAAELEEITE
jgi:hypothetical protein